jgi:phosphoglycolate phosphatase-like HAD superfamily hydrolase
MCAVALEKLGLAPHRVIAIGDTAYDVESASKMNVSSIGFLCGGRTKDELREAGCIAVYENPADLLEAMTVHRFRRRAQDED